MLLKVNWFMWINVGHSWSDNTLSFWAMGHDSPSDGFEGNPKMMVSKQVFLLSVVSILTFIFHKYSENQSTHDQYRSQAFITEMTENVTIKNQNQNGDINVPIKVRLTRDLKSYIRVRFYPTHLAFHWCLLQFSSTTIDHGLCPWGQCRVVFGGAVGAVASSMITAKVGTLQPSKPPQVPRAWRPDAEQCHRHSAPPPDERYCALEKGSGCKGDFDTSELFLRASMDFPCVSSGPQCCWTLLGVVLFKPLRIYSFHNLNLTKLANCRKAPTLDGNWWLGHCKIMFVKNYPKSSSIFGVKNRDENLHWNQPVKSGFRNPPVTPAPPALWCTGSRPRPSHAARPPVRVAGSELLGWPRSRHEMRKGHVLKFYPSKTRWTYPSTSDHFHELNWTPGLQNQLFVISKNGKLHFHQLAFFRSSESLTTS